MKLKSVYAMALGMAVLFTSCKKDPNEPESGTDGGSQKVTAKVDGIDFKSRTSGAVIGNDNNIGITASDASDNTIMLYAPAREGSFNSTDNGAAATFSDKDGKIWMSTFDGTATIKITKYNSSTKKVSGTFSFTAGPIGTSNAEGTKTITNGTFTDVSVL
ncbi:MAG TPA: DUF6252 family protein [Flavisolibacter sp.]|nr:DUF6252 family protein [Flavisolibacter sp.]